MLVVEDIRHLTEIIKKENSECSLFLFGHSAGSFLVRDYAILFPEEVKERTDGIILSGTAASPGIKDVTLKLYQGARHELINELNKQEVYGDLKSFSLDKIR